MTKTRRAHKSSSVACGSPSGFLIDHPEQHLDAERDGHGENHSDDAKEQPAGEKTEDDEYGRDGGGAPEHQRTEELIDGYSERGGVNDVGDDAPGRGRLLHGHEARDDRRG